MATWPKVKLADSVNLLAGFPFKSQQFTDKPDDVPLVKGENVSQGCILWDISKRWPASDWEKMEKFHLVLSHSWSDGNTRKELAGTK
jgi:type I restriction enzyme S subunit